MRQVLGPGPLGRPRGIGSRGRWERVSGWGTHVNPWLIHVNVWQNPLQYWKVISFQLIKINGKKKRIVEWVTVSYSRGSSRPRGRTHVFCVSCTGRQILYHWATWEALLRTEMLIINSKLFKVFQALLSQSFNKTCSIYFLVQEMRGCG